MEQQLSDSPSDAPADRLDQAAGEFGTWTIEYLESAGSTNQIAATNPRDRRVVVTNHQYSGRGRLDRVWETPAGQALTFSAVVDPQLPDADWPWVPLLSGVFVATALAELGVEASLKWPNDVLVAGQKVAGILVERVAGPLAIIGIGINVHQEHLPVPAATSLARLGIDVDRGDLLRSIVTKLEALPLDAGHGLGDLREAYRRLCSTVGREVEVHLPDGSVQAGTAVEVDDRGCLMVDKDGRVMQVGAGDVIHVRPVGSW